MYNTNEQRYGPHNYPEVHGPAPKYNPRVFGHHSRSADSLTQYTGDERRYQPRRQERYNDPYSNRKDQYDNRRPGGPRKLSAPTLHDAYNPSFRKYSAPAILSPNHDWRRSSQEKDQGYSSDSTVNRKGRKKKKGSSDDDSDQHNSDTTPSSTADSGSFPMKDLRGDGKLTTLSVVQETSERQNSTTDVLSPPSTSNGILRKNNSTDTLDTLNTDSQKKSVTVQRSNKRCCGCKCGAFFKYFCVIVFLAILGVIVYLIVASVTGMWSDDSGAPTTPAYTAVSSSAAT